MSLPIFTSAYYIRGFFGQYRYLSNFHLSPIEGLMTVSAGVVIKVTFPSVENLYQYEKVTLGDAPLSLREAFLTCTPKEARALGRTFKLSDEATAHWNSIRVSKMERALQYKFEQNKEIRDNLLSTNTKYLEESNNWNDAFWGVSYIKAQDGLRSDLGDHWACNGGSNTLGHLLMSIRHKMLAYGM